MALKAIMMKFLNKLKTRVWFSIYYGIHFKRGIKDNVVILESRSGNDMAGNILYIARELAQNPDYKHLKLCVPVRPPVKAEIKMMLQKYGVTKVKILKEESLNYYKWLSKAKYLINDTSFPRRFIKKEGQVILNTWHGTPLKNMGRDVKNEIHNMGNVMRNLVFADYLVYPNEYMKEKMVDAYMLKNLSKATILNEGYPRNSVFFNEERRAEMRRQFGLDGKQMIVYMPTWRGSVNDADIDGVIAETEEFLMQVDKKLTDKQVMYVKYHPLMKLEFTDDKYKHIRRFPMGYEHYDVLNMADTLVTDYSSVFYDFANSKRKIILYVYDKEEYFSTRGVYVSLDELPFPQTTTVDELIGEINRPKNYDDTEFLKKYCTYDDPDAAKKICQRVFLNKKVTNEEPIASNGKENILVYGGNLNKNGITTALLSVLSQIDLNKYNYYVSFRERSLNYDPSRPSIIPKEVGVIPISFEMAMDFKSAWAYKTFSKWGRNMHKKQLVRAYKREVQRNFFGMDFRHFIQFNGYENNIIGMLTAFECKRTIFVHNDMMQEIETRNNQNFHLLRWVYGICDHVFPVSEDIVESTVTISGRRDNIMVMDNFHDHENVIKRSQEPVSLQKNTDMFCPHPEGLNAFLESDGMKFITIGRFSPEKGHIRLIEAFEIFHKTHPDAKLIIIGGLGGLYYKTMQAVRDTDCWENIVLIRSVENPMPILKKCDLFILSSLYEGLGLVMLEADSLGIPVFSTDVNGPRNFLKKYGGYLVEDSMEGILQGMYDFTEGRIKTLTIDYKKRNDDIRQRLEAIM